MGEPASRTNLSDGIDADQRATQIQQFQEPGDRDNLIFVVFHRHLSKKAVGCDKTR